MVWYKWNNPDFYQAIYKQIGEDQLERWSLRFILRKIYYHMLSKFGRKSRGLHRYDKTGYVFGADKPRLIWSYQTECIDWLIKG